MDTGGEGGFKISHALIYELVVIIIRLATLVMLATLLGHVGQWPLILPLATLATLATFPYIKGFCSSSGSIIFVLAMLAKVGHLTMLAMLANMASISAVALWRRLREYPLPPARRVLGIFEMVYL